MIRIINDEQIEKEAAAGFKPRALDSGITSLPFAELGDREFELLSYLLMKQEIDDGKHSDFTKVALMQGVGERGRDCILYKGDEICGLIQCKKLAGRISRPMLLKEIIKFILFYLLDKSLIPNPKKFKYILFAANDLSEPALMLLNSHIKEINSEVSKGDFAAYVQQVSNEYESFLKFRINPPTKDVLKIFKSISLSYSNCVDLTSRIYYYSKLTSLFFKTVSIIDIDTADKQMRKALDDYGVRFLTDDDLKIIQKRIGGIDEDHRVRMGIADFFGFSREFFKYIKGDKFKEIMELIAKTHSLLDEHIIIFTQNKIHELIQSEITIKLLHTGKIHQYSISVAAPYLFQCVTHAFMEKTLSTRFLPDSFLKKINKKETMNNIIIKILHDSDLVMKGDYSHLAGTNDDIKFKLGLYEYIHNGFNNISDAERQLQKDLPTIHPILDEIEKEITMLISPQRTIIINDTSFIDNDEEFKKIINGLIALQ
ncbi:TPA: hypothetical protein KNG88_002541 [Citrobacter braakii]|nr:hypothetical protein [Citrobacter braakii]